MEFLIWIGLAIATAAIAGSKNRSVGGWFFLGLIFPLVGLLCAAFFPALPKPGTAVAGAEIATTETHVRCPDCRELVRKDARKCKHCGTSLTPIE